ncbi:beta-glucosidase BglX [Flavobacterium coralii]|uniref:beta-glucosidase BglX n=1 Tax=Flavobacterium coralii TaxID=2838017 RepID=UPI000C480326|nr:beta-glucosidase BglX [Flavobacterium sp.]|tara:strand:+ start:29154 stop:31487 length:2334 start_codon:yes stop_codon:yes gene_type:complete
MKYNLPKYAFAALLAIALGCSTAKQDKIVQTDAQQKTQLPIDRKVDSVLNLMTLEEKVGQMNQYNGFWDVTGPAPQEGSAARKYEHLKNGWVGSMLNVRGVKDVKALQKIAVEETRLGIPVIFGYDVIHGYKTISPIPLAEAASWDMEAIKKSAEICAAEAAASGLNWTFAPMVDVARDARWGRVMEGAGEDPYLNSRIAEARVKGFQGDLGEFNLAACAKHFAGYAFAEAGRDYNTVDISDNTLHNVILPPFKAAADAGALTFMNSFNELEGIPATGNAYLQREILKGEWGFQGYVVSDWGSMAEMMAHGYAKDLKQAAEYAAKAGSDMDMESYGYVQHLAELVREGRVSEETVNEAVRRILRVKFMLGLFDDPYKYCDETREQQTIGKKEFHDGVLDMAKKSIVLLKNDNNMLPLKKQGQKIAVIGALATDKTSPLGSWRIGADDGTAISVMEGLQQYKGNNLTYAKGADVALGEPKFTTRTDINTTDKSGFAEAVAAAKNADVVIMVLGEHGLQTGEGRSRSDIDLPGVQQELLETVYKANPNIVLVLTNGRPLAIPWAAENVPAIVEAWHLGTQSGNAIAQVLYGDHNPAGKLPMSFPRNVGQVPIYYNHKNTGRPSNEDPDSVFWSHYTDVENSPLYPFGYGLSYSTFEYGNLRLSSDKLAANGKITVTVDVKNTSNRDGREVVQLYLHDLYASVTRPVRELKGFETIDIKAGQSKTVTFTIDEKTIEFYTANKKWEAEPGDFKVYVGGSSDATLNGSFTYTHQKNEKDTID